MHAFAASSSSHIFVCFLSSTCEYDFLTTSRMWSSLILSLCRLDTNTVAIIEFCKSGDISLAENQMLQMKTSIRSRKPDSDVVIVLSEVSLGNRLTYQITHAEESSNAS